MPQRVNGYLVPVSCAHCGAEVEHVASSALRSEPVTEARSVVRCTSCRRQWVVVVHMRPGPHSDGGGRSRPRQRVDSTV